MNSIWPKSRDIPKTHIYELHHLNPSPSQPTIKSVSPFEGWLPLGWHSAMGLLLRAGRGTQNTVNPEELFSPVYF
jgi:hypothetical protein